MVQIHTVTMLTISLDFLPLATATLVVVLLVYYRLIYPFFLSPLAKIPNAHWTSPLFSGWILWKRFRHQELPAAFDAHQKLGPIIRLGPQDLSISCYDEGIRIVYGGGFDKTSYFDFFRYYGCGLPPEQIVRPLEKLIANPEGTTRFAAFQEKIIHSTGKGFPQSIARPHYLDVNSWPL